MIVVFPSAGVCRTMVAGRPLLCLLAGLLAVSTRAEGDEHDEEHSFEYAGAFESPDTWYTLSLDKVGGAFADAHMAVVILPMADEPTKEAVIALAQDAAVRLESGACADVDPFGTLQVGQLDVNTTGCSELHLDDDTWATVSFRIDNTALHPHLVVFTEHLPSEFNRAPQTRGLLFDGKGAPVDVEVELDGHALAGEEDDDHDDEDGRPWGPAIGATLIVCAATLSGVFLLAPGLAHFIRSQSLESVLQAFAAGALLSAAFLLLLFEATHLIADGTSSETEAVWQWGACVLGGFAICFAFDLVASLITKSEPASPDAIVVETPPKDAKATAGSVPPSLESRNTNVARVRVIIGTLIGDSLHNLCDGVFIGAAFLSCGNAFGWTVAGASIAHEVVQEISDYIVLTSPQQVRTPAVAFRFFFAHWPPVPHGRARRLAAQALPVPAARVAHPCFVRARAG
jgi:zinc transporter ZupT